jgi:F-type H+-transporting ATPase subunit delta
MSLTTIAKPYAKAIFEHALVNNSNKEWLSFFDGIEKVFSNTDLLRFIRSPKLNTQAKFDFLIDLIVKVLGNKLSKPQENFMRLIIDNDRVEVLSEISLSFRDMILSSGKSRQFKVLSAYDLSADEQKGLIKILSDKFDCDAHLEIDVQADLIGGVIIKDGDRIIDGSVNAQLEKLSYCLS